MSSQPWSAIGEEVTLEDNDSVMLLLDGETGANANKRAKLSALKTFIVDQTATVPILSAINAVSFPQNIGTFFPLSGAINTGNGSTVELNVSQVAPTSMTLRNFSVLINAKSGTTSAFTVVDIKVNQITVATIPIPEEIIPAFPFLASITDTIVLSAGDTISYRVFINTGDVVTLAGVSCTVDVPISGGLATEFTWAASDEDSPLITGILYTTEVANVSKPLEQVILSLKNTPTNNAIEVNVIQESAPDSNTFNAGDTIFTTNPQIDKDLFSSINSTIPGIVKAAQTWDVGKRLQILLTTNDSPNFAATGLKVSIF